MFGTRGPTGTPFLQPKAPEGAPNVLMIVWDDVGYGAMDVFGGPIETPTMRRIADAGIRYSNFHTTALCSPTRSSLLTGPQRHQQQHGLHHRGRRRLSRATRPHPVRERHHRRGAQRARLEHLRHRQVAPHARARRVDMSAWKGRWPLGRGFERYYGFLGGETNQWYPGPGLRQPPDRAAGDYPEEGYHLSKDLADKAIEFVRDAKAVAPDKPWFMYFCPGAAHAPHHVFKEWADRYEGRFDEGYEAIRAEILANQKKLGLLPDDTELSPINPHGEPDDHGAGWPAVAAAGLRPPLGLADGDEKKLFARMAEVYAGFVSYTDDQIGRLLDYLEESGQLDNTIIVVVSDNGASGEGGPNGSFNENKFFNNVPDTVEENLKHLDELGSPQLLQPLLHAAGPGRSTHPSPTGSAGPATRAASRTSACWPGRRASRRAASCATSTCTPSTSCRRSTSCSASPRRTSSRATSRARSRARASPRA